MSKRQLAASSSDLPAAKTRPELDFAEYIDTYFDLLKQLYTHVRAALQSAGILSEKEDSQMYFVEWAYQQYSSWLARDDEEIEEEDEDDDEEDEADEEDEDDEEDIDDELGSDDASELLEDSVSEPGDDDEDQE